MEHRKAKIGTLGIVLVLALASCAREPVAWVVDDTSAATDYTRVVSKAVPIESGRLRPTIVGSGTIQGRQEAVIASRVGGTIAKIDAILGQHADEGQVLVELEDATLRLSLSQLENQYQNAQRDLEANKKLFERGAISQSQLNQSLATTDGLGAQLNLAKDSLANASILSPLAGRISDVNPTLVVGSYLQPGVQVARVVDVQRLRIVVPVGQSQMFLVKPGFPAEISMMLSHELVTARGVVTAVGVSADPRTGSWPVLVDFDNPRPDDIPAGVSAWVSIENVDAPIQSLVPNSAMVYRDGSTGLYVVEQGNARLVPVRVLDRFGDKTAVESLESDLTLEGRQVLVSGLSRLYNGAPLAWEDGK